MRQFRIGILGCGVISNTYIADSQRFYKDLKIAACADVLPEAARAHAEKYGIEKVCTPDELESCYQLIHTYLIHRREEHREAR